MSGITELGAGLGSFEEWTMRDKRRRKVCEHIEKLVELGFVREDGSEWDEVKKDFIRVPTSYVIVHPRNEKRILEIQNCPICGELLPKK